MKKTHHSFSTQAILGVLALLLVVSFFVWRNFLLQPATIALLTEDGGYGLQMTQTQAQAANNSGATITDTQTGKKVKIVNKSKNPDKLYDAIEQIAQSTIESEGKKRITATTTMNAENSKSNNPPTNSDLSGSPSPTGNSCLSGSAGVSIADGQWVASGKQYSSPQDRECVQCQNGAWVGSARCSDIYEQDPSRVILPPSPGYEYTQGTAPPPGSSNVDESAKANCYSSSGQLSTTGTLQNQTRCYDGAWISETEFDIQMSSTCDPTSQTYNTTTNQCITKTTPPTISSDPPLNPCENFSCGINQKCVVTNNIPKCTGTLSAGTIVQSPEECISGKTITTDTGKLAGEETILKCVGGGVGDTVPQSSYCSSGYAIPIAGTTQYKCSACKTGKDSSDPTGRTYLTCDNNGKTTFHNCPTGQEYSNSSKSCQVNPEVQKKRDDCHKKGTNYVFDETHQNCVLVAVPSSKSSIPKSTNSPSPSPRPISSILPNGGRCGSGFLTGDDNLCASGRCSLKTHPTDGTHYYCVDKVTGNLPSPTPSSTPRPSLSPSPRPSLSPSPRPSLSPSPITTSPLPSASPAFVYCSQKDPKWAYNPVPGESDCNWGTSGCGIMAAAMIIGTQTGECDPETYFQTYNERGGIQCLGTGYYEHIEALESLGYEDIPIEGSTVDIKDQIEQYTAEGIPVWVNAYIYTGSQWVSHNTIATGIDDNGNIIFNDPWYGEGVTIPDDRIDMDCSKTGCPNGAHNWRVRAYIPPESSP